MNLAELAKGVFALTHPDPAFGRSNIGLIIDPDGLTIVDTGPSPQYAHVARRTIVDLTAELDLKIKRVVISSPRVPFCGGGWAFWQASFLGSPETSEQLDSPVSHEALRRLLPEHAEAFHHEFETRPITHTIDENVWISPASIVIPLPGEAASNLAVQLPNTNVVFVGALASFGVTPLAFDGDPLRWAESLEVLAELGTTVVPGHGPIGSTSDLTDLAQYLRACAAVDGDATALPAGPWDTWTDRHFDAVNVERAARLKRGDQQIPQAFFELLGFEPNQTST